MKQRVRLRDHVRVHFSFGLAFNTAIVVPSPKTCHSSDRHSELVGNLLNFELFFVFFLNSRAEIDIDTETDETDCEAIIDLEDNESCVESLETVHVNGDAGGDEEMTLEMRYESVLAGELLHL